MLLASSNLSRNVRLLCCGGEFVRPIPLILVVLLLDRPETKTPDVLILAGFAVKFVYTFFGTCELTFGAMSRLSRDFLTSFFIGTLVSILRDAAIRVRRALPSNISGMGNFVFETILGSTDSFVACFSDSTSTFLDSAKFTGDCEMSTDSGDFVCFGKSTVFGDSAGIPGEFGVLSWIGDPSAFGDSACSGDSVTTSGDFEILTGDLVCDSTKTNFSWDFSTGLFLLNTGDLTISD